MAQKGPASPEKQLLRLIEDPKNVAKKGSLEAQKFKRKGASIFSLGALRGRISFLRDNLKRGIKGGGRFYQLNIKLVNIVLLFSMVILAVYLIVNFTISLNNLKQMADLKFDIEKNIQPGTYKEASLLKPASYYLGKVKTRDIFSMVKKKQANAVKSPSSSAGILEVVGHLKLVGISWSADPDVMIEDTKAKRTHFLKKGDSIDNIKLEEVYKDKVVLEYKGEKFELR
jgi:hypothetical protein